MTPNNQTNNIQTEPKTKNELITTQSSNTNNIQTSQTINKQINNKEIFKPAPEDLF